MENKFIKYKKNGDIENLDFKALEYNERLSAIQELVAGLPTGEVKEGVSLFIQCKNAISQDKLREAGFKIVREPMMADLLVIEDFTKKDHHWWHYDNQQDWSDQVIDDINKGYKFTLLEQVYPFVYKNKADLEWYKQLDSMLDSRDNGNIKMAMEFMTNTDWSDNQIQLAQLFASHWPKMSESQYKTSISFKGLLNSLSFNYNSLYLDDPIDYAEFCTKDEDHKWVDEKYKERFAAKLKALCFQFKTKIVDITTEIDKSIDKEEYNKQVNAVHKIEHPNYYTNDNDI